MTIKRNFNGAEMEIELTWQEMEEVQKEIKLEQFIWEVENIAGDMEIDLTDEQTKEIAKNALDEEEERDYYRPMPLCSEYVSDRIREAIEEIAEEK